MEALDFPPGSEVITPALTFSTTVGCLVKNGLIPVFVDVEPLSYNIDTSQIEEQITSKTVAIMAPNLMGNLCDWAAIREISDKHGLLVIEDSADTLGATLNGKSTGAYTDVSTTSFYGSHIINCAGNGGALALNNDVALERAKLLRSWGRRSSLFDGQSESIENRFNEIIDGIEYDSKFVFECVGYNLEGSEVGAAFGLVQLSQLDQFMAIRQSNFTRQSEFFAQFDGLFHNPKQIANSSTAWLAFPILIDESAPFSRKDFQIYLEERAIQTRVVFTGNVTRQPMCKDIAKKMRSGGFPNADNVMERGVLLPVHHGMTEMMFERLHETIAEFIDLYS